MKKSVCTLAASLVLLARVSATGYCNDRDKSCAAWAKDGECTGANAEHLAMLCPHSCGTCTITCEDTDVSCASWAKNGDCESNKGFMLKVSQRRATAACENAWAAGATLAAAVLALIAHVFCLSGVPDVVRPLHAHVQGHAPRLPWMDNGRCVR